MSGALFHSQRLAMRVARWTRGPLLAAACIGAVSRACADEVTFPAPVAVTVATRPATMIAPASASFPVAAPTTALAATPTTPATSSTVTPADLIGRTRAEVLKRYGTPETQALAKDREILTYVHSRFFIQDGVVAQVTMLTSGAVSAGGVEGERDRVGGAGDNAAGANSASARTVTGTGTDATATLASETTFYPLINDAQEAGVAGVKAPSPAFRPSPKPADVPEVREPRHDSSFVRWMRGGWKAVVIPTLVVSAVFAGFVRYRPKA